MKRHCTYLALATGCVLLALTSCVREQLTPSQEGTESGKSAVVETVFTCTFEAPRAATPGSKVDIINGEGAERIPAWVEGDKCNVFSYR